MASLYHVWGEDLVLSANGGLLLVDGSEAVRQRVIRRLLTNSRDLLFHLDYGAGLPAKVGETTRVANLEAVVRSQILREAGVAQDPPPEVVVTEIFAGAIVNVTYTDAATGAPVPIGFTVER